jgi:hypothetical protein
MYITATHKVKVVLCKPITNVNTPCQAAFNNISSSFHAIKNLEIHICINHGMIIFIMSHLTFLRSQREIVSI